MAGDWAPPAVSTGRLPGGGREEAVSRCAVWSTLAVALAALLLQSLLNAGERWVECWWLEFWLSG